MLIGLRHTPSFFYEFFSHFTPHFWYQDYKNLSKSRNGESSDGWAMTPANPPKKSKSNYVY